MLYWSSASLTGLITPLNSTGKGVTPTMTFYFFIIIVPVGLIKKLVKALINALMSED